jgi:hypothetical protein
MKQLPGKNRHPETIAWQRIATQPEGKKRTCCGGCLANNQEAMIELHLRGSRNERSELLGSIRETLRDPRDTMPPLVANSACISGGSLLCNSVRRAGFNSGKFPRS